MSILVADDEPDIRKLIRMLLSADGLEVVEAADGHEALEAFRTLQSSGEPAVVILDNRMPRMTGLQAAAQMLREAPAQRVILLTAFLDDDVVAEATRLGISRAVSKRETITLPKLVRALLGDSPTGQSVPAWPSSKSSVVLSTSKPAS